MVGEDCAKISGQSRTHCTGENNAWVLPLVTHQWGSESVSNEFLFINSDLCCRFQLAPSSLSLLTLSLSRCLQHSLLL